jgi:hypothetical protein
MERKSLKKDFFCIIFLIAKIQYYYCYMCSCTYTVARKWPGAHPPPEVSGEMGGCKIWVFFPSSFIHFLDPPILNVIVSNEFL